MPDPTPTEVFPTDEVTLAMLRSACQADDTDGRSHLFDFLDFGSVEKERTQLDGNVYEVTYEPGRAPWSVHEVLVALVDEVGRLRAAPGAFDTLLAGKLSEAYNARLLEWASSLEAIVRELAEECGPPLDPEWGDCPWCEEPGVVRSSEDPSTHTETCTWRKACEWVAAHPSPAPDTEGAAQ